MPKKNKTLLVVSSTYPATSTEKVPAFVKDQLEAFISVDNTLKIHILAPHNQTSRGITYPSKNMTITEHRFHYFLPRFERLTDMGIMPALQVSKLNYLLIPFLMIGEFYALWRLVSKVKPDLIYAHWFTPQAINASLVSRITKIPYVYTSHASDVEVWRRFGWVGKKIVRFFSSNAKVITAVSTQTKQKLTAFFENPPKIHIIPMGVNLPKISKKAKKKDSILFIGRLTEKKGIQYLLPAMKNIIKIIPNAHLHIAGDGEMKLQLENMTNEYGLEKHVTFHGFVSGSEKTKLLDSSPIMVVPSIITDSGDSEGLPVSLMEGLAHGLICVATHESGAGDILSDKANGFLVPQKNIESLTESLLHVLNLPPSQEKGMRINAVSSSKKLSWESIAKQHLELFSKY